MPFCTECGGAVMEQHRFCAHCGAALSRSPLAQPSPSSVPTAGQGVSEASREVAVPRSRSTLLADRTDTPASVHSAVRRIPPVAVVAGILSVLALSALAGYRLFRGGGSPASSAVVEATEQAIGVPGAPRPSGPLASEATVAEQTWTLVADATHESTDAEQALGAPDQKVAMIAPGGSLAVAVRTADFFYNGRGADVDVHGPEGTRTRYTIFSRTDTAGPWVRFDVNNSGFRNGMAGHDMGHHGTERARQIMIKNEGGTTLAIDALTPLHLQPEAHDDDHAALPAKPRVRQ